MPNTKNNSRLTLKVTPQTTANAANQPGRKHTKIFSDCNQLLLKIKHSQGYNLSNQLSAIFKANDKDCLKSQQHFIMEMLQHAVEHTSVENNICSLYVELTKKWLDTLDVLHKIFMDTTKAQIKAEKLGTTVNATMVNITTVAADAKKLTVTGLEEFIQHLYSDGFTIKDILKELNDFIYKKSVYVAHTKNKDLANSIMQKTELYSSLYAAFQLVEVN